MICSCSVTSILIALREATTCSAVSVCRSDSEMSGETVVGSLEEILVKQEIVIKEEEPDSKDERILLDQGSGVEISESGEEEPEQAVQTLKCALQASMRDFRSSNEDQAQRLSDMLENLVHMSSLLSIRGSRFLNAFLISSEQLGVDIDVLSDRKRLLDQIFKRFIPDAIGKTGETRPNQQLIDWCNRADVSRVDRFGGVIPLEIVPKCCWKVVTDNIVKRYRTVFENHLVFNFESRLRRYFQTMTREKKKVDRCIWMVMRIGYDPMPSNPENAEDWSLTTEMEEAIMRERERFFPGEAGNVKKRITEALLKKHYKKLLGASKEHLQAVEEFNQQNEDQQATIRTWNLAPMCSIKRHFVPIDQETLYKMLKHIGYFRNSFSFDDFKAIASETFESIFSSRRTGEPADGMPKKRSRQRRHCHGNSLKFQQNAYIQTDGVSVCIQYRKVGTSVKHRGVMQKRKAQAASVKNEVVATKDMKTEGADTTKKSMKRKREDKRRSACTAKGPGEFEDDTVVYGLDPGRTYIAYVVRLSDGKVFKLSRKQYRAEGGIVYAEKTRAKMNRPLQDVLEQLSANSSKTCNLETFMQNIDLETRHFQRLWDVGYSQKASRLRFHTHCKTQCVLHRFFSQMGMGLGSAAERKRRVFVSYGQAKFSPTGRNEMAVPTTSAFKACSRMWHTHLVDEFRTTKVCHDCLGELVDIKSHHMIRNIRMMPQQVKVNNRNLKRCPNACKSTLCDRHSPHRSCVLKNRDLNAAKNIALLGRRQFIENRDRPDAFKRARRRARRNPDTVRRR